MEVNASLLWLFWSGQRAALLLYDAMPSLGGRVSSRSRREGSLAATFCLRSEGLVDLVGPTACLARPISNKEMQSGAVQHTNGSDSPLQAEYHLLLAWWAAQIQGLWLCSWTTANPVHTQPPVGRLGVLLMTPLSIITVFGSRYLKNWAFALWFNNVFSLTVEKCTELCSIVQFMPYCSKQILNFWK